MQIAVLCMHATFVSKSSAHVDTSCKLVHSWRGCGDNRSVIPGAALLLDPDGVPEPEPYIPQWRTGSGAVILHEPVHP
jgi:hypothetical protein